MRWPWRKRNVWKVEWELSTPVNLTQEEIRVLANLCEARALSFVVISDDKYELAEPWRATAAKLRRSLLESES